MPKLRIPPTIFDDAEPLTATELAQLEAQLATQRVERTMEGLKGLSQEQQRQARKLLVRLRKSQPKKPPHRPLKWTPLELRVLRAMYKDVPKLSYEKRLKELARLYGCSESTIKKRLTQANKLPL